MPTKHIPGVRSLTLTALRRGRGLLVEDLADRADLSDSMVTYYETEQEPSYEKLCELAGLMDYEPSHVDSVVFGLSQVFRPQPQAGSPVDPTPSDLLCIREISGRVGRGSTELLEQKLIQVARSWRVRAARRDAAKLWRLIERTPPDRRRSLVETSRRYQTWAVAERLAHESEKAASDRADRALELAELAYRVAELAPGGDAFVAGVLAYALAFVANARRVANQIRRAGEDFARAVDLWEASSPGIRKLLPAWRLLDLEGSLRRDQRRFPEALAKLREAQAIAPPKAVSRILVKRAVVLEHMGDYEEAVRTLREAESLSGTRTEVGPRHQLTIKHNLASNLCHLGFYHEAAELLPAVRRLATAGRRELDLVRFVWVQARCNAGLGRVYEARAGFEQVRREFVIRDMAADCALVSLERAVLDLQEGRYEEVRAVAEEMAWIFKSEGLHPEALAALKLFRQAVAEEKASVELARRIVRYLYRAQLDPKIAFEA